MGGNQVNEKGSAKGERGSEMGDEKEGFSKSIYGTIGGILLSKSISTHHNI